MHIPYNTVKLIIVCNIENMSHTTTPNPCYHLELKHYILQQNDKWINEEYNCCDAIVSKNDRSLYICTNGCSWCFCRKCIKHNHIWKTPGNGKIIVVNDNRFWENGYSIDCSSDWENNSTLAQYLPPKQIKDQKSELFLMSEPMILSDGSTNTTVLPRLLPCVTVNCNNTQFDVAYDEQELEEFRNNNGQLGSVLYDTIKDAYVKQFSNHTNELSVFDGSF